MQLKPTNCYCKDEEISMWHNFSVFIVSISSLYEVTKNMCVIDLTYNKSWNSDEDMSNQLDVYLQ